MTTIIAEIGQNHCGDMSLAKKLIELAKESGADLVKFQLYDGVALYGELLRDGKTQIDALRCIGNELSHQDAIDLFFYGKKIGMEVFFSVFDGTRVQWCEQMGVARYKIATMQKSNEVIEAVANTNKEAFISFPHNFHNGGFWNGICREKIKRRKLLLCVPSYPATAEELSQAWYDVAFVDTAKPTSAFNPFDGYSDHTIGLDSAKEALERGATIIEKHFCLEHDTGIDAPWSMTPEELKELRRFADAVKECL